MSPDPTVTVIIPAFNAARTVATSIRSALEQTGVAVDVLVVDDGSTDDTPEVLRGFAAEPRVRILHHPDRSNRGTCASRRLALQEARGEFVAFLDADDDYLPGKLARHSQLLREMPAVLLVHGPISPLPDYGLDPAPAVAAFNLGAKSYAYALPEASDFLSQNRLCNSTVVCRRSAILTDDLPPEMVFQFEDWVLFTSLAFRGDFYYDATPLTVYRVQAGSFTQRHGRRSGALELAQIEYLLTVLARLPRRSLQRRATDILLQQMMRIVDHRSVHGTSAGWPALGFLSVMARIAVPKYAAARLRVSRPWQWLARLTGARRRS